MQAIKKLYDRNWHVIKLSGKLYTGPQILAGVRQGCPLSMILFAICIEPLLRMLEKAVSPDDVVGSFADDIALVIQNLLLALPRLLVVFKVFGLASGLKLNLLKCVLVPLGDDPDIVKRFADTLRTHAPSWSSIRVQLSAEYLGFMLGPDSHTKQWDVVIRKACDTSRRWANLHSGMFYNVLACNVYILPLFSYVGQLALMNKEVVKCLSKIRSTMFSGPGGWIPQYFLHNMTVFGFPVHLRCLGDAILASQVRTAHNLSMDTGRIAAEFGLAYLAFQTRHGDSHVHSTWHAHAFIANLGSASQTCKAECEPLLKGK